MEEKRMKWTDKGLKWTEKRNNVKNKNEKRGKNTENKPNEVEVAVEMWRVSPPPPPPGIALACCSRTTALDSSSSDDTEELRAASSSLRTRPTGKPRFKKPGENNPFLTKTYYMCLFYLFIYYYYYLFTYFLLKREREREKKQFPCLKGTCILRNPGNITFQWLFTPPGKKSRQDQTLR